MTLKERLKRLTDFINGTQDEHIAAFAAQTAFFIFLSLFPLISLLLSLSKFLPFTRVQLIEMICRVIPARFEDFVVSIINDIYLGGTATMTIVSAVIALWSAAKGLMAIRNGLNEVYRSREQRNYVIIRGISSAYTALFLVMLVMMIPLNMFGTQIVLFVINRFPNWNNLAMLLYGLRTAATFIVLLIFFWMMYVIVPNRKLKFIRQLPGALFSAISWIVVTKLFSLYIDQFMSNSYMYGSLTMVILMMMWLYIVSNLIFIGGQINEYLWLVKYKEEDAEISRKKKAAKEKKKALKEEMRRAKKEAKLAKKEGKLARKEGRPVRELSEIEAQDTGAGIEVSDGAAGKEASSGAVGVEVSSNVAGMEVSDGAAGVEVSDAAEGLGASGGAAGVEASDAAESLGASGGAAGVKASNAAESLEASKDAAAGRSGRIVRFPTIKEISERRKLKKVSDSEVPSGDDDGNEPEHFDDDEIDDVIDESK